ncbi:MAG: hypothetical protein JXP34_21765 [Planctomycetes bacterium]|nr:hypothetical protein [Planctomycetota bacterium]
MFEEVIEETTQRNGEYPGASLLRLKTADEARDAITDAICLLHDLLDPWQRREIAFGVRGRLADRHADDKLGKSGDQCSMEADASGPTGSSHPAAYALFSREWISTVPTVLPVGDLRERILLRHLPPAGDGEKMVDRLSRVFGKGRAVQSIDRIEDGFEGRLRKAAAGKGVSLAGTWYLGALSGGNMDVATDVIRELVTEYHERDRLHAGGAAPVACSFYDPPESEGAWRPLLPYQKLVSVIYRARRTIRRRSRAIASSEDQVLTFPFCRARIRHYTSISLVLTSLVRRVMREYQENQGPQETSPTWKAGIRRIVEAALREIRQMHDADKARKQRRCV